MALLPEKETGRKVRLRAVHVSVNRKRGVAHAIVYTDDNKMPDGDWSCGMMKPYPKRDEDKPWFRMVTRWNALQR